MGMQNKTVTRKTRKDKKITAWVRVFWQGEVRGERGGVGALYFAFQLTSVLHYLC